MTRRLSTLVAATVCASTAIATAGAQGARATPAGAAPFVTPARRAPDAPPPMPPELPPGSDAVAPLTLHAVVRRQPASGPEVTVRQVITRTADRIHVSLGGDRAWLFERNPVDHRRTSGVRVDPAARTIVVYGDSELRTHLGVRGWLDVLVLGFDPGILKGLAPSGDSRTVGGLGFPRFTVTGPAGTREIWWSQEQLLALSFDITDATGTSTFTIDHVRQGVDASLLQPLPSRFPRYEVVELADLLDRH